MNLTRQMSIWTQKGQIICQISLLQQLLVVLFYQVQLILLKVINEGNKIGDIGIRYISKSLATNTTLVYLDISRNSMTDEGGKELAAALKQNKTLRQLQMGIF